MITSKVAPAASPRANHFALEQSHIQVRLGRRTMAMQQIRNVAAGMDNTRPPVASGVE